MDSRELRLSVSQTSPGTLDTALQAALKLETLSMVENNKCVTKEINMASNEINMELNRWGKLKYITRAHVERICRIGPRKCWKDRPYSSKNCWEKTASDPGEMTATCVETTRETTRETGTGRVRSGSEPGRAITSGRETLECSECKDKRRCLRGMRGERETSNSFG